MNYLNPDLRDALGNCFGHVHVTNAGSPAAYEVRIDLDSYAADRPRGFIEWRDWGETYSVNCPECGDTRGRFYVGHMWGVFCSKANRRVFSCTKCWNEGCRVDLFDILRGGPRLQEHALQEARSGADRRMELPGDPQDLTPVSRLPASHPAAQYLASRGFDLDLLSDEYGFVHCSRSPWKKGVQDGAGNWHLVTPENRIIIPNIQQGSWQGWMARYLGEVPRDPVTGKPVVQKYLNAPGYSMGTTVYRLDEAAAFSGGSFCLVCEGAMSAIACGAAGVATFGMYPRPMQEELLASRFRNGRLVFLVESEAAANGRIYGCIERLGKQVAEGCATVLLDAGKDAANLDSDTLLGMIENALGGSGAPQ
jgi:hypothetical protein